jgi:hypothetical protein
MSYKDQVSSDIIGWKGGQQPRGGSDRFSDTSSQVGSSAGAQCKRRNEAHPAV